MRSAASKLSASRCCRPDAGSVLIFNRSMTTSISCFSVFFSFGRLSRFEGLAVDSEADIALRQHLGEQVDEFALAVANHRRQHHQPGIGRQRQGGVDHLRHALRFQRHPVLGTERRAGAGIQQADVVVDLGDRADRRARVVAGCLLLDADGRAQALDDVDIGLVHQLQKLPRVGRQAFDIASLAFGIQGIEGQARFARSAQPGDHHQLVAWNVEVDIFQIVRARTADPDRIGLDRCVACAGSARAGWRFRDGGMAGHEVRDGQPDIITSPPCPGAGAGSAKSRGPAYDLTMQSGRALFDWLRRTRFAAMAVSVRRHVDRAGRSTWPDAEAASRSASAAAAISIPRRHRSRSRLPPRR